MKLELPHEIGFAVITAEFGDMSNGILGIHQHICGEYQSALYDVLTAGDAEGREIKAVKVGAAYAQPLADIVDRPLLHRSLIYGIPELFEP